MDEPTYRKPSYDINKEEPTEEQPKKTTNKGMCCICKQPFQSGDWFRPVKDNDGHFTGKMVCCFTRETMTQKQPAITNCILKVIQYNTHKLKDLGEKEMIE